MSLIDYVIFPYGNIQSPLSDLYINFNKTVDNRKFRIRRFDF